MSNEPDYRVDEQLLGDVESLLSFWPLVRDDPQIGPGQAMRVLATWAHLRRFSPAQLDQTVSRKLDEAVRGDTAKLVERCSELTFIDDWVEDSEALDQSWDGIVDNEAADEADLSAICLFDLLDRFSLASYACQKLLPGESDRPEGLSALIGEVAEGEDFLADHPDVFLGAAEIASANLGRYRPDLDEVDGLLWETTLKHRALEELLEERAVEQEPRKLTREELDELLAAGSRAEPRTVPIHGRVYLARAAGRGRSSDPLIDQLASQSPAEAPTDDYRRAWAHFLASSYAEADPTEWLDRFLSLIEDADPPGEDWTDRKRKAQSLTHDRDWKRHYAGEEALKLNPQPLASEEDLLRCLNDLLCPPSPAESGRLREEAPSPRAPASQPEK